MKLGLHMEKLRSVVAFFVVVFVSLDYSHNLSVK